MELMSEPIPKDKELHPKQEQSNARHQIVAVAAKPRATIARNIARDIMKQAITSLTNEK
jgi:hypothetical protein